MSSVITEWRLYETVVEDMPKIGGKQIKELKLVEYTENSDGLSYISCDDFISDHAIYNLNKLRKSNLFINSEEKEFVIENMRKVLSRVKSIIEDAEKALDKNILNIDTVTSCTEKL